MKKTIAISVVAILILTAVISREFWLPAAKQFWIAHAPDTTNTTEAADKSTEPSRLNSLKDTFTFAGKTYYFYRVEKIPDGWMAAYSPSLDIDPADADSSVDVGYYYSTDGQSNIASAKNLAAGMEDVSSNTGAIQVQSGQDGNDQDGYFYSGYYLFPENQTGVIALSKYMQDGNQAYLVMFKQVVHDKSKAKIQQAVKKWLADNSEFYSAAIGSIQPAGLWFQK